jgi:hypothetical protein
MIITKGEPQYKEKEKDGISGCPEWNSTKRMKQTILHSANR